MPVVPVAADRLAGSRRVAAAAALVSTQFGAVLIVWGASVQSATMTGGGVLAVGRGVMAVMLVVGIRLATRRSATFPDGLYKIENLFAALAGLVLLVGAYELARAALPHLDGTLLFSRDPTCALPFFLAAAVLGLGLGWVKRRVGKAEGCPSLQADAYFSFADAGALVLIGVALTLDISGVPGVDAIVGLIVAVFVAVVGMWILHGALRVLLDASISREVLAQVCRVAQSDPGIRRVDSVDGRNSGSFVFLHLVVTPATADVRVAQGQAASLEQRLLATFPNVDSVRIELSACPAEAVGAVMLSADGTRVAQEFSTAPRLALVSVVDGVPHAAVQANPAIEVKLGAGKPGAGVYLAAFLGRSGVTMLLLPDAAALDDELARQTLTAYAISIRVAPGLRTLADAESLIAATSEPALAAPQPGGRSA